MSELKLRLDIKDFYDAPRGLGVVASIYPVAARDRATRLSREERQNLQNILIPAGDGSVSNLGFRLVSLPPGTYFVEAILPSGESVGEEVLVPDSSAPQELRLASAGSPHEWLSWQAFSGNVAPAQTDAGGLGLEKKSLPLPVKTFLLAVRSPGKGEPPAANPETAWLSQGYFFCNPRLQPIPPGMSVALFPGWKALNPPAQVTPPLPVSRLDPNYEILDFTEDTISGLTDLPPLLGKFEVDQVNRYYLFAEGPDLFAGGPGFPRQFSVLPVPWGLTGRSGEARVQALVSRAATAPGGPDGLDQGFRISMVVQEGMFGSLIGYLGAGRLQAADTILRPALDMLRYRSENPLAGAAGAYVLLGNPGSERPADWNIWVRGLMNRFPWLPDGAILYGKLLMDQKRDEDSLKQARECFLEGFRRGLPYFSKGVDYLLSGLNRFARDAERHGMPDGRLEAALNVVRDLAQRTNVRQPFTTVLLD